ncbi:hypothetical protein IscW_ISCW008329 [Ixodes scapularis]|uniref:Uncharacterized protein n=1 Tax=Ixodes scapularis TaxID=6945 RepID=B7PSC0_IXOSC|nr:hypothetical protein IscW_ISCW008329 [Ixodes scapularis]|eukprot:XP_002402174.1 hypothetical protein IscW_ISCW008329 [Ixodes scapularis]
MVTMVDLQWRAPCLEHRETQTVHSHCPESTHQPGPGFLGGHLASVTLHPSAEGSAPREDDTGPTYQPDPVFSGGHPAIVTLQPPVEASTCSEDDARRTLRRIEEPHRRAYLSSVLQFAEALPRGSLLAAELMLSA